MAGEGLFNRLVEDVCRRALGEPAATASKTHQILAIAVIALGGGIFFYCIPRQVDQRPKLDWALLLVILLGCGFLSMTFAVAGRWRIGVLRSAASLLLLLLCIAALLAMISGIGFTIHYLFR